MTLFLAFFLQDEITQGASFQVPLWVQILVLLLGTTGVFFERIKSTIENWQNKKAEFKHKLHEDTVEEKKTCQEQIKSLREKLKEKDLLIQQLTRRTDQHDYILSVLFPIVREVAPDEKTKNIVEHLENSIKRDDNDRIR
jgi:hypothetical protein